MSSTYTTASGTVSFIATTDNWAEPASANVDVIAFPGGDAIAISISGQREMRRTFKALFQTIDDFKDFRDMRAREGWLLVEDWDTVPVNAVLIRTAPDPIFAGGEVLSVAEFILY